MSGMLPVRVVHWRYLRDEAALRWKRWLLAVTGIAMATALVLLLDVLGRAFAAVSALPFRNLGADLIVQRSATQAAIPKQMGLMLPYSAQPISRDELNRLSKQAGVNAASGFVLLWNFGTKRFFSISGLKFDASPPLLGPARVRDWLLKGRLPKGGQRELLVERHYGAFYGLKPGRSLELGGRNFTIVGVVDIKAGSQITASNFYMDIAQARTLAGLADDTVNQVFLKVAQIDKTEAVKKQIAAWLPNSSIISPGTMLKLFGGISQVIGGFHTIAVLAGGLAAAALVIMLLQGGISERRKDASILRTLGWTRMQMRIQLVAESTTQGLAGGVLALVLLAIAVTTLHGVSLQLPASLPGENPVNFVADSFRAPIEQVALPIHLSVWVWFVAPLLSALFCGLSGWLLSARVTTNALWAAIKAD